MPCEHYELQFEGRGQGREERGDLMVLAVTQGTSNAIYRNEIFWGVFCSF